MAEHTPGKWWLCPDNYPDIIRAGQPEDDVCIAELMSSHKTMKADAHLIAAAPELLVALEKCHHFLRYAHIAVRGDNIVFRKEAADFARAAIAKARGQSESGG